MATTVTHYDGNGAIISKTTYPSSSVALSSFTGPRDTHMPTDLLNELQERIDAGEKIDAKAEYEKWANSPVEEIRGDLRFTYKKASAFLYGTTGT